ncbi:MAG: AI-2E family transporter, partial [Ruminiclostridium sp.]|nr:AI-2E family transporter [Ruminiclostridium sp.]
LGESTGLTSFWVIFARLVGQGIFGFWGLIIGIPLFAVIYSTTKTFVADRLKHKGLPSDSDDYTDIALFKENEEGITPVSLSEKVAAQREEKAKRDAELKARRKEERENKRKQLNEKLHSLTDIEHKKDKSKTDDRKS